MNSDKLSDYVDHCLTNSFGKGGMVLQDLVNEIGRRLDYTVTNGRYQGVVGAIGFDGVWRSPDANDLVVEVKTTDTYRILLDVIANYRKRLAADNQLTSTSSILIVVGRDDTGELEAQIRDSRHAWDMRLISIEALLKLLKVKENLVDLDTGAKIRSLFAPVEYTRLDRMVDVVFTAANDVELVPDPVLKTSISVNDGSTSPAVELALEKGTYQFTDSAMLQAKRVTIVDALSRREGTHILQKSRAQYWSADRSVRCICSISKRYLGKNQNPYWYAYHPQWDTYLDHGERSFFVLGCMDLNVAFAIPLEIIRPILPTLHQTVRPVGAYWHIHLVERNGGLAVHQPNSGEALDLAPFAVSVGSSKALSPE